MAIFMPREVDGRSGLIEVVEIRRGNHDGAPRDGSLIGGGHDSANRGVPEARLESPRVVKSRRDQSFEDMAVGYEQAYPLCQGRHVSDHPDIAVPKHRGRKRKKVTG
jgi:hypothetical protein